jgi:hypothetical protein
MDFTLLRDLAIIVLAVESIVIGIAMIFLILQVRRLTRLLEEEIRPILKSARRTVGMVQGTTSLVSETLVTPAVKIGQMSAGIRRTVEVLVRGVARKKES